MEGYTKIEVKKLIRENDVKFLRLQFTDVFGSMKNVAVTDRQIDGVMESGYVFDGSSVGALKRETECDMYLVPACDSFVVFPWRPQQGRVARLICDIFTPEGKEAPLSTRAVMKRVSKEYESLGYTLDAGPECEFFLFNLDEKGQPTTTTHDKAGYLDIAPYDMGENARREMVLSLEDMGFEVQSSHHEGAPGQHEIFFSYDELLSTADKIMTFKSVVKVVAQRHGLYASFMPKPLEGINGSGMHVNFILKKGEQNVFAKNGGLSDTAKSFIAGILEHINEITAITNPLVNSYKRLVPGYESPSSYQSEKRGGPLLRVPVDSQGDIKIELRSPDPSCNPYLALALIAAAGLDGIKRGLTVKDEKDLCAGAKPLPEDLSRALDCMSSSSFVKNVLGEELFNLYCESKKQEWLSYSRVVHPWELEKYFEQI